MTVNAGQMPDTSGLPTNGSMPTQPSMPDSSGLQQQANTSNINTQNPGDNAGQIQQGMPGPNNATSNLPQNTTLPSTG